SLGNENCDKTAAAAIVNDTGYTLANPRIYYPNGSSVFVSPLPIPPACFPLRSILGISFKKNCVHRCENCGTCDIGIYSVMVVYDIKELNKSLCIMFDFYLKKWNIQIRSIYGYKAAGNDFKNEKNGLQTLYNDLNREPLDMKTQVNSKGFNSDDSGWSFISNAEGDGSTFIISIQ
ncbi:30891_t:CDS:2, partial [Gigaspora margarita]